MTDTPSFQDLLDDFADEMFVGRVEQLSLFEGALTAEKPSFLILNISGQGGVGKSTLLERYRGVSKNNNVAYAIVNEDHLTVPKILETFVSQLEPEGLDFDRFNEQYRKYQELNEKIESDPKAPSGLMDFALRGFAKAGIKSLKRIPVAGDIADAFLSSEAEDVIADQASELTKYVFQRFTNKDERVLLLETNSELTKYFLEDLTKGLKKQKVVLSFDTYEKTSDAIEKWLLDMLSGTFGKFGGGVLFVIAGRYSLGQNWTRFRKAIRQLELKEFTEQEARDYLLRSGITDEKLILQFIESSERLPVLLALLVSAPEQLPHNVSGDAVNRFLEGLTPEQKEAALISSLPRYFNSDILESILGEEEGKKGFEWLSKAHFVRTSENGWVYHDVVRAMMIRYFRMRSNEQFVEVYYRKQIANILGEIDKLRITTTTSRFEAEKTYHFLCQNPLRNIEILVKNITSTKWKSFSALWENSAVKDKILEEIKILSVSYSNSIFQLCDEISEVMTKEQISNFKDLARLFSDGSSDVSPKVIDWLFTIYDLNDQEKSALYILRTSLVEKTENSVDLNLAVNDFTRVVQLNPLSIVGYMERGQHFMENKNYDLALFDFSKAKELQPDNEKICRERGKIYFYQKDYPAALVDFSKAIELQSENDDNYFWRGLTFYEQEDYSAARLDFSKAIELQPEDEINYGWRGRTCYEQEDYLAAIADFSKAMELQPEVNGYYWRARARYEQKDYSAALLDFSKAIELRPEEEYNYYWRGLTCYAQKDYSVALLDFSKTIELQPEDGGNYYRRGLTYYRIEDYSSALADFSKAIELQPEDGFNYNWRGRTHYDMKDYLNALTEFSKAIELQPENGVNYSWRGSTYYNMKDYPNALTDLTKAIELQPEDGNNYNWRGRTHYDMKDYSSALTDLTKAIELQPEDGNNYNGRGLTYYDMKDYSSALTNFSKAIELQPEDGFNYNWRGRTQVELKDYPAALTDFTKAIELQPENWGNYNWRGAVYFEMSDYASALTDFTKAIELQPEDGGNYYWRGSTYYNMKDYPNALTDLTKAIELQPEDGNNYNWRGRTYYQMKDYLNALTEFSKAIELQPEDRNNYYWRGRTRCKIREYPAALTDFSKAVELQPENGYNYFRRALCHFALGNERNYYEDVDAALQLLRIDYEQNKESNIAFMIALCSLANGEAEKAQKLYEETISQCFDKNDLSNALKNLEEFTDLLGKTKETEFVMKSLNEALAKLS